VLNELKEIWKEIEGFEGRYQVSNLGRVMSLVTNHGKQRQKLKPQYERRYMFVNLSVKNRGHTKDVHRMVANAFVPNPDNKPMVNHIDGVKLNNNASNLEWVTCSENHKHAYASGLRTSEGTVTGKKLGQSSVYRNVSWDNERGKWMAAPKIGGKQKFMRRFDSEIEAAKHVDFILALHGITDRPRNFES